LASGESEHRIGLLKKRTVELCAEFCCDGDLLEAKGKLELCKDSQASTDTCSLGVKVGVAAMLLLWFLWEAVMEPGHGETLWNDPAIYLYSFLGNLVIYDMLWALNVFAWETVARSV
jgi:hypothetical protein